MAKVIHVHLIVGKHSGLKDFYFSSISAVYTVLTSEEVGLYQELLASCWSIWQWVNNHETSYYKAIYAHFWHSTRVYEG